MSEPSGEVSSFQVDTASQEAGRVPKPPESMDLHEFGDMSMLEMQQSKEPSVGKLSDMIKRMVEPESSLEEDDLEIVSKLGPLKNGSSRSDAGR